MGSTDVCTLEYNPHLKKNKTKKKLEKLAILLKGLK